MALLNRVIAYVAAAGLCVPLGLSGYRAWQTLSGAIGPTGPAAGTGTLETTERGPETRPTPDRIAGWNLFGAPPAAAVTAPPPVTEAPKTRLQLTLRGVAASPSVADARAIIADPSGRERHYRPGEAVPGGAELGEIHPDRVILMRNGRPETLPLAKLDRGTPDPITAPGALGPGARRGIRMPRPIPPQPAVPAEAPQPAMPPEMPMPPEMAMPPGMDPSEPPPEPET